MIAATRTTHSREAAPSPAPTLSSHSDDSESRLVRHPARPHHRQTVARHLKRAGLTLRTNTSDPVFRLRVQQTYQTIGTIKGTARHLGVSPGAVRVVVQGE
ncbi:hypothetical protein BKH19_09115 [Actinomyces oris]|nr:hypothetical protein BKH19_09115 [Actinomyces oris]